MRRLICATLTIAALLAFCHPADAAGSKQAKPKLLLTLPTDCNTPDGACLSPQGDIILSVPNFNNAALLEAGKIKKAATPKMVSIDKNNKLSTWYEFQKDDYHPDTGQLGPMDCAFGPDGNLYLADNQVNFDGAHKSRVLRVNCKDGKAVDCDVVVEGFIVSNGMAWRGDQLFVSETILAHPKATDAEPKPKLISGVYAFDLKEMNKGVIKLKPYSKDSQDERLVAVYETSNRIGFGADGVCFDSKGAMYCSIFEDGAIYKSNIGKRGTVRKPKLFAKADCMASADGMVFREADQKLYTADMLRNGVQAIDMEGAVETLWTNGDTTGADGSLDQPCEVLLRGDELIVVNMDMWWDTDLLVNKAIDEPYTLSVIQLPKAP